jgi:NADH:ubiquinone oxidoreductase subunit E
MPSYVSKPAPPNQDKRWKLVDATMRRQGQQSRGLIETLHTVQEAFGYLDVPCPALCRHVVARALKPSLRRGHFLPFLYPQAGRRTHLRDLYGNGMLHQGSASVAARGRARLGNRCR